MYQNENIDSETENKSSSVEMIVLPVPDLKIFEIDLAFTHKNCTPSAVPPPIISDMKKFKIILDSITIIIIIVPDINANGVEIKSSILSIHGL